MIITESYSVSALAKFAAFSVQNYFWHLHLTATTNIIQLDFSCLNDFSNHPYFTANANVFVPGDSTTTMSFAAVVLNSIPQ